MMHHSHRTKLECILLAMGYEAVDRGMWRKIKK
jgi:hypothetical protein